MKHLLWLSILLYSCYQTPKIEGFDPIEWNQEIDCNQNRIDQARVLIGESKLLLSSTQNEITNLLGSPNEHELYSRNEKFFYYDLSPECDSIPARRLSVRFDALGRMKDMNIIQAE